MKVEFLSNDSSMRKHIGVGRKRAMCLTSTQVKMPTKLKGQVTDFNSLETNNTLPFDKKYIQKEYTVT